ncbi:MAG: SAF domain-containing protein [Acidimicrobiales bacterium]
MAGGFLVAVAAIGTFAAYRGASGGATHRYVVAARSIAAGTKLTAADVSMTTVDLPDGVAEHAFVQTSAVLGRVALAAVSEGELVQSSAVADAEKADARYELSLPLDRARALGGSLVAGELVDVLVTYGTGNGATTLVVARRAEVVAIDAGKRGTVGGSGDLVLELALRSAEEVLAVTHASQAGAVTIVRATGAAAAGTAQGPDEYRPPPDSASNGG